MSGGDDARCEWRGCTADGAVWRGAFWVCLSCAKELPGARAELERQMSEVALESRGEETVH